MRSPVAAARYRVVQFLQALTARHTLSEEEIERAMGILTVEARKLFYRQAPQDQRHALAVYKALRRAGHTNSQLLTAALLHDVGKAALHRRFPAYMRAAFVLLDLLNCLNQENVQGWRRFFADYARHPEIGACWAEEAGCSSLTVALIRRHQERLSDCQTEEDRLLRALQAADGMN